MALSPARCYVRWMGVAGWIAATGLPHGETLAIRPDRGTAGVFPLELRASARTPRYATYAALRACSRFVVSFTYDHLPREVQDGPFNPVTRHTLSSRPLPEEWRPFVVLDRTGGDYSPARSAAWARQCGWIEPRVAPYRRLEQLGLVVLARARHSVELPPGELCLLRSDMGAVGYRELELPGSAWCRYLKPGADGELHRRDGSALTGSWFLPADPHFRTAEMDMLGWHTQALREAAPTLSAGVEAIGVRDVRAAGSASASARLRVWVQESSPEAEEQVLEIQQAMHLAGAVAEPMDVVIGGTAADPDIDRWRPWMVVDRSASPESYAPEQIARWQDLPVPFHWPAVGGTPPLTDRASRLAALARMATRGLPAPRWLGTSIHHDTAVVYGLRGDDAGERIGRRCEELARVLTLPGAVSYRALGSPTDAPEGIDVVIGEDPYRGWRPIR